jgi:membrane protease YdiL (CAAX protease family)
VDRLIAPLVLLVVGIVNYLAFSTRYGAQTTFYYLLLITYGVLTIAALGRMYRDGTLIDLFRWRGGDVTLGVLSGSALVGAMYAGSRFLTPVGSANHIWLARIYLHLGSVPTERKGVVILAVMVIALAFFEEIVWRGLVQQSLEETFGVKRGWLMCSGLYALAYSPTLFQLRLPGGSVNPMLMFAALLGGTVWGFLAGRKQRLPPAMLSHAVFSYILIIPFRLWGI